MKEAAALRKENYNTLSFDCYGTLIDWENGILGYLQPLLDSYDVHVIDDWLLAYYAEAEPQIQALGGSYSSVLARILEQLGNRLGFSPSEDVIAGFGAAIEYWPSFPDTRAALQSLRTDFQLVALSNIDDALFQFSSRIMGDPFDRVITAEQIGAYKPDPRMFEALIKQAQGPILHVAQSRYHDIVPASAIGLDTVWINRPSLGAAQPVDADPTWTFDSMQSFAAAWH